MRKKRISHFIFYLTSCELKYFSGKKRKLILFLEYEMYRIVPFHADRTMYLCERLYGKQKIYCQYMLTKRIVRKNTGDLLPIL